MFPVNDLLIMNTFVKYENFSYVLSRVVNEYPVNRLTVERTEYRLVKLVLGYSVKKYKQNVANIKIRSV